MYRHSSRLREQEGEGEGIVIPTTIGAVAVFDEETTFWHLP